MSKILWHAMLLVGMLASHVRVLIQALATPCSRCWCAQEAASGATTGVPATHRVTKMEFLVPNFGLSYPLLLWPFGDESVNGSFLLFPVFDSTSSINKSFKI